MSTSAETGINGKSWLPSGSARGAFLLLHGMESHSGWFGPLGERLAAAGWAALAFDRPGWGMSAGRRGHMASYRDFVELVAARAVAARDAYGSVHLAGMSWGGMAALYLALRRGWLFDSIAMLAPGIKARLDIPFSNKLAIAGDFFHNHRDGADDVDDVDDVGDDGDNGDNGVGADKAGDGWRYVTPVFQPRHFTKSPEWQHFIADDPLRVKEITTSFCIETVKMRRFIGEKAGKRITPPLLCLLAGDDKIIHNRATAAVAARSGAEVRNLPGLEHTLALEDPDLTARYLDEHAANAPERLSRNRNRIWIVGGGAVGGALGSLLAFGGQEAALLVKDSHLPALRPAGFTLTSGAASRSTGDLLRFGSTPQALPQDPDLVVVAVKSHDTFAAATSLIDRIPSTTVVASLQNGVDNEKVIASLLPDNPIAASAICCSLELAAPGRVIMADDRGGLGGAVYRGNPGKVLNIWQKLSFSGLECRWYGGHQADQRLKWSKLMLNIGFNALNSMTGLTSARILAHPEYGVLAVRAMKEGFAAMKKLALQPVDLPDYPVSKLRLVSGLPISWSKRMLSWQAGRSQEAAFSMRQDVVNKRQRTEINELNGKIVEMGNELGFPAPANSAICEMMKRFLSPTI